MNINTTSISDYETRTPPLTRLPPYLPYWTHGGWGTVKAYFPNGPTTNDQIYETTFDPENPEDMRELRSVLKALPHGAWSRRSAACSTASPWSCSARPTRTITAAGSRSPTRSRGTAGPRASPCWSSSTPTWTWACWREEGYAYMGKVSVEGDADRNWDQAYKAAVTEALLWDVDILLVSGGMKGVTVGSNITFPSAAAGYSQVNYSLSLMGAKATGITEGKGKAVLSADAYRFYPGMLERRRIPASLYERIRLRARPVMMDPRAAQLPTRAGRSMPVPGGAGGAQVAAPMIEDAEPGIQAASPAGGDQTRPPPRTARRTYEYRRPVARIAPPPYENRGPGINVSRQLYEMAGFPRDQQVGSVNIR